MELLIMQKMLLRSFSCLVVLAFALSSPLAHADSVTYDVSGSFANGASLTGWVNLTGTGISAYNLGLSNSTGSTSCTSSLGLCFGVLNTFSTTQGSELLAGLLNPFGSSLLTLTGPGFQFSVADVSWNVAMPEGSEVLMLVLAMLAMGFAVYRAPKPQAATAGLI
jgi:hypothetical protein